MKRLKKLFSNLPAVVFLVLFAAQLMSFMMPQAASADLLSDQEGLTDAIGPNAFNSTGSEPMDIRVVVANVIRVFLGLLGIMFLVLIVLAGYKWMMAQGDSGKVDEAKDQLKTSTIGLAIILAAWGVTIFVMNSVLKATDPNFIWGL